MIKNISKSFSSRLLFGIFGMTIMLLSFLLYYTFMHSKMLMLEHLKLSEEQTLTHIAKNIELDIKQLSNEMEFLTKLSVMHDIIADDMDGRILQLLEAKKITNKFKIDFKITTQKTKELLSTSKKAFKKSKGILFQKPIYSDFLNKKRLGTLELYLPLKELNLYINSNPNFSITIQNNHDAIANKDKLYYLSKNLYSPTGQTLLLTRSLLKNELDKQLLALKNNLILLALILLIFLFILAYVISLRISKPILDLSKLMKKVSSKKAYYLRSDINRADEIGVLSQSFNRLLHIIEQNIAHIQAESEDKIQQFTDLVSSFSKITQQQNTEEINKVLNEVKLLATKHQGSSEEFLCSIQTLAKLQHERIELQDTQVKLLEEATHLAQNRSHFIAQISHEFKTPLNSIIGFSQVIEHEKLLLPPYDKMASNIEKSGKHLLLLVNQVLNVANQNHTNESIVLSHFSLTALIAEVLESLAPQINKMHLKIIFKAQNNVSIFSDERMIKQVLINLISNAIKFSNHKNIDIKVEQLTKSCTIHIKDQGIGMKAQSMKNLFLPFVRLPNAIGLKGTGLGLALAQSYIQKLGGEIEAKSEGINQGSEFIIKVKTNANTRN